MDGKNMLSGQNENLAAPVQEAQLFHALLQESVVAFAYLDQDFDFVYVSQAFAQTLDSDPQALLGRNYFDVYPDADGEVLYRGMASSRPNSTSEGRFRGANVLPVSNAQGDVEGLLLIVDHAVRLSAAGQQSDPDSGVLPTWQQEMLVSWRFDVKAWRFVEVSPEALALFGYAEDVWCAPGFLERNVHPGDLDSISQLLLSQPLDGQPQALEHRIVAADGRTVWVRSAIRGEVDAGGVASLVGEMVEIEAPSNKEIELLRVNRALHAMRVCTRLLVGAKVEKALLNDFCRILVDEGGYRMAWVGYADNGSEKLVRPVAQQGINDGRLERLKMSWADVPSGEGAAGTAIRGGQTVVARCDANDPDAPLWREAAALGDCQASISLPLRREGVTFAVLNLYAADPDAFPEEEKILLGELADDLAFGIAAMRERAKRHVAERNVLASEQELLGVLSTLRDTYYRTDEEGCLTRVSPSLSKLLGYPPSQLLGRSIGDLYVNPDEGRRFTDALKQRDGNVTDYEIQLLRSDGAVVWVSVNAHFYYSDDGRTLGVEGVARDVSQIREDRQTLVRLKAEFAAIFNAIPDAVVYADRDRRIVMANSGVKTVFGYEPVDLVGHASMLLVADALGDEHDVEYPGAPDHNQAQPLFERLYRRKDGTTFIGETMGNRVCDADGRDLGYIAFIRDVTQREHQQQELNRLKSTLDKTLDCIFMFEPQSLKFFYCNEGAINQVGYTRQELLNMKAVDIKPQLDESAFRRLTAPLIDGLKDSLTFETVHRAKDGHDVPVEVFLQYIAPTNEAPRFMAIVRDTTERRQAEARMRKLSMALEQTADSICITDREGNIEYINPAFEEITGYNKNEVVGQKISVLNSGQHNDVFYKRLWETILAGDVFRDIIVNRKKDGSLYYDEKTITPLKNDYGDITHFVSAGKDITERVETQKRLQYLTHHDVLTGLPNRALLLDRIEHALARIRDSEEKLAILFLDLDRFKIINDTLGHAAGDRLLQLLADRFGKCLHKGDTVARLSGDEFAVLVEDIHTSEQVAPLARSLLAELAKPFAIEDRDFFVTASIGISVAPGDGSDPQSMLKHAETAMYRAKDFGRNTYQFYSADMSAKAFERLSLETSLRYALERDQFALYYQPQMDISTGRVVGVEALLRWRHPDLGLVSPVDFIPILEETGLIMPVGEWVLYRACQDATRMRGGTEEGIRMSVNLSARQFSDPGLTDSMERSLIDTGLRPELLEMEITESVIMQDDRWASRAFDAIRDMNVHLAIDDFGTGYSSLAYLKRFPINTLKIDRTFIRDIISDPDDAAIVRAIIAMAESLKLRIIAEGVETEEQLTFLLSTGCGIVQGYFYSPPVPFDELQQFLDNNVAKR